MQTVVLIFAYTVNAVLMAFQFAMLLRVILSLFAEDGGGRFYEFLCAFTEPIIMPLRLLFERMGWFQNSPLDVPFFVTYLLVAIISTLLILF